MAQMTTVCPTDVPRIVTTATFFVNNSPHPSGAVYKYSGLPAIACRGAVSQPPWGARPAASRSQNSRHAQFFRWKCCWAKCTRGSASIGVGRGFRGILWKFDSYVECECGVCITLNTHTLELYWANERSEKSLSSLCPRKDMRNY